MIPSLWPTAPDVTQQNITINPGINNIDYPTANLLLESGQVKLVDVREADEYRQGYIIGAINIPVDSIKGDSILADLPNYNEPIIVYCLSGKRAQEAALKLRRLGYNYLLNMGGISHWPYGTVRP
jgi:phage shock protein E